MPYKQTRSLSSSECEQIINASALEDFISIKNLLLTIIEENTGNNTKDDIAIRILSNAEWNKYIISSILEGTITANNINVWHYHTFNDIYIATNSVNHRHGTASVTVCRETTASNTTSNALTVAYRNLNIRVRELGTPSGEKSRTDSETMNISKRQTVYQYWFDGLHGITTSPYGCYCSVSHAVCFRPVFQFNDTNKSSGIFY